MHGPYAERIRLSPWPSILLRLAASALLVTLVWLLHRYLIFHGPFPGDRWAVVHYAHPATERHWVRDVTAFFSDVGTPGVAIALTGGLALLLLFAGHIWELIGLLIAVSVVAANALLKQLWGPTPLWTFTGHVGANFPSGHTAFATALFGYIAVLAYRYRRYEITVIASLFVIGMGPSRVIAGVHLFSDAIAGYMLGFAWLLLATVWLDLSPTRIRTARRRSQASRAFEVAE